MDFNKIYSRMIKVIAFLVLFLFIANGLLTILWVYILGIHTGKIQIPTEEISLISYLIGFVSILLTLWISLALLGLWVFDVWMKIEESIKGKVVAGREDFWGILKVIKAYPYPLLFLSIFITILIMMMKPISIFCINHMLGR